MSRNTDPNAPAFPTTLHDVPGPAVVPGMTLRQYAAITLKLPNSGTDWLDDMIRASLRDDFAAKVLPLAITHLHDAENDIGFNWHKEDDSGTGADTRLASADAYSMADSMLKARKGS